MQSPEQERKLTDLEQFWVSSSEEPEATPAETKTDPEGSRFTQASHTRDLGPIGQAEFIRGTYDQERLPDGSPDPKFGREFETWKFPGEVAIEIGDVGALSLSKVRTGRNQAEQAKGGAVSFWGDGEFHTWPSGLERPTKEQLDAMGGEEVPSSNPNVAKLEKFDFGGGRTVFRETGADGKEHVYMSWTLEDASAPSVELKLPQMGGQPNRGERALAPTRLTLKRIEANLDADAGPPYGRAKFTVTQETGQ